jgi:phage shock protein C
MYCTKCGAQNTDGSRFCTGCGASTSMEPDAAQQTGTGYSASGAYASAPPRRLRRVMSEKKIAGVCAGFAEYFDMDVTLVRLIWVGLMLLPPSPGLIIYIVAWAILPRG